MVVDERRLYRLIGSQLRQRRVDAGLTQAELAERAGLLRTSVTNIEAGRQKAPLHVLYAICAAMKADVRGVLPSLEELDQPALVAIEFDGAVRQVTPQTAEFIRQLIDE